MGNNKYTDEFRRVLEADLVARDFTSPVPTYKLMGDNLPAHGAGLAVPGHRDRSQHPHSGWTGDVRAHDHRHSRLGSRSGP